MRCDAILVPATDEEYKRRPELRVPPVMLLTQSAMTRAGEGCVLAMIRVLASSYEPVAHDPRRRIVATRCHAAPRVQGPVLFTLKDPRRKPRRTDSVPAISFGGS